MKNEESNCKSEAIDVKKLRKISKTSVTRIEKLPSGLAEALAKIFGKVELFQGFGSES